MKDFRELKVWHKAHELALAVYKESRGFPKVELYGLTSQARRAGASIAANIAEGCGRQGDNEFRRFLQIAMGSANELDYHVLLAKDLGFLPLSGHDALVGLIAEVKRMLWALIQKVSEQR